MSSHLLSITIPTKNSEPTLVECLESVTSQPVRKEVIVADDCSTDRTLEIATRFGATVLPGPLPLLEARYQALKASRGDLVLLLDSDQVVNQGALERALEMIQTHDALILEEHALRARTLVERLFAADKRYLNADPERHADPASAAILPRIFKRGLLEEAFSRIPPSLRHHTIAQDHALLYRRVGELSPAIGIVNDAIRHQEMTTLRELMRKYFRWGADLPELFAMDPETRNMTTAGVRARLHRGQSSRGDWLGSLTLMGLKTAPYLVGFSLGWVRYRFRTLTTRDNQPLS